MNLRPDSPLPQKRRDVLRLDALEILKELAEGLAGIEDIDALLWSITEQTISKLGWADCVIYLLDKERKLLIQKAAFGPKSIDYKAIFKPITVPLGSGVVGKCAETGKATRIKDTAAISEYIEDDAVRFSEMAVPILWGKEVLGVIDTEHHERDFYQKEDQLILETLAGITATKIQNAKNAQVSQSLALFYECNPNPVLQIDSDRKITYINESARLCFQEALDEGSTIRQPGLTDALNQAVSSGQTTWRCRGLNSNTQEVVRTGEFNIVHLPSGLFNLYGSDITHFLTLQKAAEAATEAKSRFLSVMSHEIRTPLNAILGLTDLLIQSESEREEQLRHLAYMEFSGRHLLSLVNDILDLEKMASGKAKSTPSEFNVHELAETIVNSFQNRAQNVGLALTLDIHPDLPKGVKTDIRWLTQILNNLIGNAIKYTESGTVHLSMAPVQEPSGAPTAQLCNFSFSVTDTGFGIPKEELHRILEPFEQINNSAQIEGTGLGLAIVQGIVQQMSGSLAIDSEVGVGSTFNVTLPLALAPRSTSSLALSPSPQKTVNANGEKDTPLSLDQKDSNEDEPLSILLADDNELNRFVANKLLQRWGYQVLEALNGSDAVQIWKEKKPALILMDIQMPVMDGIEATQKIRIKEKQEGLKRTPIIALTADAENKTYDKIQAAGMDDRIVKPFDPVSLRRIIDRTTTGSHQAD